MAPAATKGAHEGGVSLPAASGTNGSRRPALPRNAPEVCVSRSAARPWSPPTLGGTAAGGAHQDHVRHWS